jgi:putative ABC transport system permease protein
MFARLLWKLLRGSRGRLAVAIVALVSGAAVISALINLDLSVEHQLTQEFRTLGPNLIVSPKQIASSADAGTSAPLLMDQEQVVSQIDAMLPPMPSDIARRIAVLQPQLEVTGGAPYLYIVARVGNTPVVVAGTFFAEALSAEPTWKLDPAPKFGNASTACIVGRNAAGQLKLGLGSSFELQYGGRKAPFSVSELLDTGSAEDNQIFVDLRAAQRLAGVGEQISLVQLRVNGTTEAIAAFSAQLAKALPQFEVQPIRQVTEAEGAMLHRIQLLIVSMVALILILTALCVLATMAALAMERRADVGLMKALGGSISRIVGLFLAEVGVLGAAGGLIGCIAGVALSRWMGERVFGTSISARWEIFPLTIGLMIIVALAGALPLRLLGKVKPAVILRGE